MYTIEKGIAIPNKVKISKAIYPFAKMKSGDSFLATDKTINQLRSAIYGFKHRTRNKSKFVTAKEKRGIRVFCV